MNFIDAINLGYIPEGYKKHVTPEIFATLDAEHQYYYEPEYKEYRNKKVRSYYECEECGHKEFTGWEEQLSPIGKPYRYRATPQALPYGDIRCIADKLNTSNVLM